jgi:hypothetical protein
MKTFKELLEGKFVDTHLGNGRPNPNHPAHATHKATYDQFKHDSKSTYAKMNLALKTPRAKEESPVKLHHIDAAIGNAYPDVDPYEHLAKKFPELHKQDGKSGSKLMDHLNKVAKAHGSKDFHDHVQKAHDDFAQNESVNEEWEPDPLDKGSADAHALSKTARNDTTGHVHLKALAAHKHMLAGHKEAHSKVAPQHKRFHELAIRDHETQIKRHTQMAKAFGHLKESEEVDGVENDISTEQRKIYDAQSKAFMKDRKAQVKESMSSFKEYINELSKVTLGDYAKTANDARAHETDDRKADNRGTGVMKALDKLAGKKSGPLKGAAAAARFTNANGLQNAAKDRETFNRKVDRKVAESVELDEVSTAKMSHQGKSVIKGIDNPDVTQRMAAHDVKPGIKGYSDRIALLRDAKAKGNLKEENLEEISTDAKHKYIAAAQKSVRELGRTAQAASLSGDKEKVLAAATKLKARNDTAIRTMGKADIETRKKWNSDFGKNESVLDERDNREDDEHGGLDKPVKRDEFDRKTGKRNYMPPNSPYKGQWKKKPGVDESVEQLEESPFDWKNKPSEVKWNDDSKDSGDNSGVHSARTKARNAEGGALEKKSVGRPVGKHDGYKIDRAARDTPEHKTALSKKVIAAKADGFKQQGEFKSIVNRGLAKDALDKEGINPDDHKAAIEKHVKKAAGKFYSPHGQ